MNRGWMIASLITAGLLLWAAGSMAMDEMKRKIEDRRVALDWNRRHYGKRK